MLDDNIHVYTSTHEKKADKKKGKRRLFSRRMKKSGKGSLAGSRRRRCSCGSSEGQKGANGASQPSEDARQELQSLYFQQSLIIPVFYSSILFQCLVMAVVAVRRTYGSHSGLHREGTSTRYLVELSVGMTLQLSLIHI